MNTEVSLDGRVAVITGAGHGIGRLQALELARRGAAVVVNDVDQQAHAEVVEAIRAAGGRAIGHSGSVAVYTDAESMIAAAIEAFGRVDIVVNNAGILRDKSFHKLPIEDLDRIIDIHLRGTAYVTHAAWPYLRRQGYGRVVFTASSAGLWGNFGQANYAAAKLGVVGLMQALELEGAGHGIFVNTIAPYAMTRMGEGIFPEGLRNHLSGDSVVGLVTYLCSERCATSGETFEVGARRINRVRIQASDGIVLEHGCDAESVQLCMSELLSQPTHRSFSSVWEAFESFTSHCASDATETLMPRRRDCH